MGLIHSFFSRKAFISDSDGNFTIPISKPYSNRSAPQGSIISPLLWRLFDAIFTKIFLDALETLKSKAPDLHRYSHLSYSDDHLYVLFIEVSNAKNPTLEDKIRIQTLITTARKCLESATSIIGSGLSLPKSETIVYDDLTVHIADSKTEFVWLGFSLLLDRTNLLTFTYSRIRAKTIKIFSHLRYITSVCRDTTVKMKIYETYVRPILEYYSICYELSSKLASFQHQCLCICMGIHGTASKDQARDFAGSPMFNELQARNACKTLDKFALKIAPVRVVDVETRSWMRSAQRPAEKRNPFDFFHHTRTLVWEFHNLIPISSNNRRTKFVDDSEFREWKQRIGREVSRHIAENTPQNP